MIAYFDCFAGASGDMILAALLDAGASIDAVRKAIGQIDVGPVEIDTAAVERSGLRATQLVIDGTPKEVHEIPALIRSAGLDPQIEAPSLATLGLLAAAEARVHGTTADQVHFHELDGLDTIVDVVGAAAAIKDLGITKVISSPVATGSGTVQTSHGTLPLPPPAVVELLKGRPIYSVPVQAELLTPTGAALLAHWASDFGDLPPMTLKSIGYGAGTRVFPEFPNLLRVIIGDAIGAEPAPAEEVLLEANIDDMNPEFYGYVAERLFDAGADDVWMVPAIGKRGRPATILSVLGPSNLETALRDLILTETSTIGVRSAPVRKHVLERNWVEVVVEGFAIRVKIATREGRVVNIAPEYSDCAEAARQGGLPLKEVFRRATELGGRERI